MMSCFLYSRWELHRGRRYEAIWEPDMLAALQLSTKFGEVWTSVQLRPKTKHEKGESKPRGQKKSLKNGLRQREGKIKSHKNKFLVSE